jgi:hypothetical protein
LAAADIYEPVCRRFPLTPVLSFPSDCSCALGRLRLTDYCFASPSISVLFRSSLSLHTNSPPPSGGFTLGASSSPLGAHYPLLLLPVGVVVTLLPVLSLVLRASSALPPLLYSASAPSAAAWTGYTVHAIMPLSVPASTSLPWYRLSPVSFVPDHLSHCATSLVAGVPHRPATGSVDHACPCTYPFARQLVCRPVRPLW